VSRFCPNPEARNLVWNVVTALPPEKIVLWMSKPLIGVCKKSTNVDTEKQMPPLEEMETEYQA
jgi:hypothetical protein